MRVTECGKEAWSVNREPMNKNWIEGAAKLLGHAQVSTTARYSHLSRETLLAAVEASANATGADWGQAQRGQAGDNLALATA